MLKKDRPQINTFKLTERNVENGKKPVMLMILDGLELTKRQMEMQLS